MSRQGVASENQEWLIRFKLFLERFIMFNKQDKLMKEVCTSLKLCYGFVFEIHTGQTEDSDRVTCKPDKELYLQACYET